ncbi:flavin reductase family protein [Solicola gregarius]|uniref:Flavin reductase family protein n=1 Tax=Solicola gregarius TaxID=2908642 RepID=A0AA46TGP5_9ACTN|nr:flavin reductase family protein [Solicola gregarius]UYM04863.1 flavin reductase family protein [Solicola gregarius]
MTIHSDHPFLPPEGDRDPVRRLRGRTPAPVTVFATEHDGSRAGLTVSSMMIADGDPAHVLALVDEDSDLWDALEQTRVAAVSLLSWRHRGLADAFAGVGPAPGGPFRLGSWEDTTWGPVVADTAGWAGVRLADAEPRHAGWALLVDAVIEHVEIRDVDDDESMSHLRGRYRRF